MAQKAYFSLQTYHLDSLRQRNHSQIYPFRTPNPFLRGPQRAYPPKTNRSIHAVPAVVVGAWVPRRTPRAARHYTWPGAATKNLIEPPAAGAADRRVMLMAAGRPRRE